MKANISFVSSKTKNYDNQKTSLSNVNRYRLKKVCRINENCQIDENRRLNRDKIEMTKASTLSRKRYRFCLSRRSYLLSRERQKEIMFVVQYENENFSHNT